MHFYGYSYHLSIHFISIKCRNKCTRLFIDRCHLFRTICLLMRKKPTWLLSWNASTCVTLIRVQSMWRRVNAITFRNILITSRIYIYLHTIVTVYLIRYIRNMKKLLWNVEKQLIWSNFEYASTGFAKETPNYHICQFHALRLFVLFSNSPN